MILMRCRRSFGIFLLQCSLAALFLVTTSLHRHVVESAQYRGGSETVATAAGRGQLRGAAVWVAVRGEVDHLGLTARALRVTGKGLYFTDCSNAFDMVDRAAMLPGVTTLVTALTPFVAECYKYGKRLSS